MFSTIATVDALEQPLALLAKSAMPGPNCLRDSSPKFAWSDSRASAPDVLQFALEQAQRMLHLLGDGRAQHAFDVALELDLPLRCPLPKTSLNDPKNLSLSLRNLLALLLDAGVGGVDAAQKSLHLEVAVPRMFWATVARRRASCSRSAAMMP